MVGAVPEHICKRQSRYLSVTADAGKCAEKAREGLLVFCFFVTVVLLGARQSTIQSVQNESAAHRSSKKA